ncbi:hypothetical protein AAC387_Pa04g2463 [Persea americana]
MSDSDIVPSFPPLSPPPGSSHEGEDGTEIDTCTEFISNRLKKQREEYQCADNIQVLQEEEAHLVGDLPKEALQQSMDYSFLGKSSGESAAFSFAPNNQSFPPPFHFTSTATPLHKCRGHVW